MHRVRMFITGLAVTASVALALPGSAVAQAPPSAGTTQNFQVPSFPSPFVPGRQCGSGLLGFTVVPGQASTDGTGSTTFGMTFEFAGDGAGPNLGSATVRWLNLGSFRSGVATFPITDDGPSSFTTSGEVTAETGRGPIVASIAPDVSFAGERCNFSTSLGGFLA